MVIWDRLQAHRSAAVKGYRAQHPEIMVEELPTYAPDLNPEEGCHGDVKRHLLNATPEDTRQIRKQANRGDSSRISTRLSRDSTWCLSGLGLRLAVFDGF